jgi:flagellar hook-basal body complex protein FliE
LLTIPTSPKDLPSPGNIKRHRKLLDNKPPPKKNPPLPINMFNSQGIGWFNDSIVSTFYTISDKPRLKLLYKGTLCGLSNHGTCAASLPDGEYVFRVGGNLDFRSSDNSWEFCSMKGTVRQELIFSVLDGKCIVDHIEYAGEKDIDSPIEDDEEKQQQQDVVIDSSIRYENILSSPESGSYSGISLQTTEDFNDKSDAIPEYLQNTSQLRGDGIMMNTGNDGDNNRNKVDSVDNSENEAIMNIMNGKEDEGNDENQPYGPVVQNVVDQVSTLSNSATETIQSMVSTGSTIVSDNYDALKRGEIALEKSAAAVGILLGIVIIFTLIVQRRRHDSNSDLIKYDSNSSIIPPPLNRKRKTVRFVLGATSKTTHSELGESSQHPLVTTLEL